MGAGRGVREDIGTGQTSTYVGMISASNDVCAAIVGARVSQCRRVEVEQVFAAKRGKTDE